MTNETKKNVVSQKYIHLLLTLKFVRCHTCICQETIENISVNI